MTQTIYPALSSLIAHQARACKTAQRQMTDLVKQGSVLQQVAEQYVDHMQGILASLEELQDVRTLIHKRCERDKDLGRTDMTTNDLEDVS